MARKTQKADLKSWKRKFLGITAGGDGETREDILSNAQKLINIFRQLQVLDNVGKSKFEQMVLDISPDMEDVLWSMAGGKDILGFRAFLQEKLGILVEEEEESLENAEIEAEKARAKIIAEAISLSQAKTAENLQKQSMAQVEQLSKVLGEAKGQGGGGGGNGGGGGSSAPAKATVSQIEGVDASAPTSVVASSPMEQPVAVQQIVVAMPNQTVSSPSVSVPQASQAPSTQVPNGQAAQGFSISDDTGIQIAELISNSISKAINQSQFSTAIVFKDAIQEVLSERKESMAMVELGKVLSHSQREVANTLSQGLKEVSDASAKNEKSVQQLFLDLVESQKETTNALASSLSSSVATGLKQVSEISEKNEKGVRQIVAVLAQNQQTATQMIMKAIDSAKKAPVTVPTADGGTQVIAPPPSAFNDDSAEILGKIIADALTVNQKNTSEIMSKALISFMEKNKESDKTEAIISSLNQSQERSTKILYAALTKIAEQQEKQQQEAEAGNSKVMELLLDVQAKNNELLAGILDRLTPSALPEPAPSSIPELPNEEKLEPPQVPEVPAETSAEVELEATKAPKTTAEQEPEKTQEEFSVLEQPETDIDTEALAEPVMAEETNTNENAKADTVKYFEDEDLPYNTLSTIDYEKEQSLTEEVNRNNLALSNSLETDDVYFDESQKAEDIILEDIPAEPISSSVAVSGNIEDSVNTLTPTLELENILPEALDKDSELSEDTIASQDEIIVAEEETSKAEPIILKNVIKRTKRTGTITSKIIIPKASEKTRNNSTTFWFTDNSEKKRTANGPYILFAKTKNDNNLVKIDIGRVA